MEVNIKKLAILGKLPTKHMAPFDDPTFEIWSFNHHEDPPKRVDKWFDLHKNGDRSYNLNFDNFPFELCESIINGQYFNNSASYIIMYAIICGYKHIYLYGMRFNNSEEVRQAQFWNVRELIAFAKGKGIKIEAPYDQVLIAPYERYIDWKNNI